MYKSGAHIILNDIGAEDPQLSNYLHSIPKGTGLKYYLEDAAETIKKENNNDVLFSSGFAPDEIRRNILKSKLKRFEWPENRHPYHEILRDAIKTIKPGGLLIFQHYYGGVNPIRFKNYFPYLKKKFEDMGLTLIDIYVYRLNMEISLIAACKGKSIPFLGPEIDNFHGRSRPKIIKHDIIKYLIKTEVI